MKSSDAYPEPDETEDGALEPGSTATGSPTSSDDTEHPATPHSAANPDALVEHNRVATAEDME
ncbi:hypothetical protein BH11ACT2_BH11ACT2_22130 [soil metagenome]